MSLCKCMNCRDKGFITIRNNPSFGQDVKYRKEWCSCTKGIFLKKEMSRDMYAD